MKKLIINDNQRGLIFRNGRFLRAAEAGKYWLHSGEEAEVLDADQALESRRCGLETLLADPETAARTAVVEVGDRQRALHFTDGRFAGVLGPGKHAFWAGEREHSFQLVDAATPDIPDTVPQWLLPLLPDRWVVRVQVASYEKARLFFDNRLVRVLESGTHCFWRCGTEVTAETVDTRQTQLCISGQELLTADKVSLRITYVCTYRITDCVKVLTEVDRFDQQLYVAAQLALRELVGRQRLDDLLDGRERLDAQLLERLRQLAAGLYVEISGGGVRDIILPGQVRDIMNTVLVAEKQAQANVIARREEVASTRSLLNTARLMDENRTLMRLKEMEYVERICQNVGNITVDGSGGLLAQLGRVLGQE